MDLGMPKFPILDNENYVYFYSVRLYYDKKVK